MDKDSLIFVAGHRGLVGSAICNSLIERGFTNLILRTHSELDLTDQNLTFEFFQNYKPEAVILSAAKVGGIVANNTYRADFIYQNLQIATNVIHASHLSNVKKLIFLGSNCIYPKQTIIPIKEEYLLTSSLEFTNEPYAIAKIAGLKMCEAYSAQYGHNFFSLMPANIYGENDNYDFDTAHVFPSLIRRIYCAKMLYDNNIEALFKNLSLNTYDEVVKKLKSVGIEKGKITLWGSGAPKREFLHSKDLGDAIVFALENINYKDLVKDIKNPINTHLNVGSGIDISISELANLICEIVGFKGKIFWDKTKPDGTLRKLMDVSKMAEFGWISKIDLEHGIKNTYEAYKNENS